jgi:hypothetical protein
MPGCCFRTFCDVLYISLVTEAPVIRWLAYPRYGVRGV